jgi:serine/threonine protein kinase
MEWLDGEDLSRRLRRSRLSLDETLRLVTGVAEALGAAHARGIIHRDLKPSNLFLVGGRPEQVKLVDFGIAQLGDLSRMTRTGMALGTPAYMAPEQARGDDSLDLRADLFSLGCVLFECVTGQSAFKGAHVVALLRRSCSRKCRE